MHLNVNVAYRPTPALAKPMQVSPSSHATRSRLSPSSRSAPRADTGASLDDKEQPQIPGASESSVMRFISNHGAPLLKMLAAILHGLLSCPVTSIQACFTLLRRWC